MPIYEYRCDKCGHEFETIQKISETPLETCPECAENGLRKKVSAAGFRLKGGGWYETDFKKGTKKNVSGGETAGDSGASGGTEGGADPKKASSADGDSKSKDSKSKDSKGNAKSAASE